MSEVLKNEPDPASTLAIACDFLNMTLRDAGVGHEQVDDHLNVDQVMGGIAALYFKYRGELKSNNRLRSALHGVVSTAYNHLREPGP